MAGSSPKGKGGPTAESGLEAETEEEWVEEVGQAIGCAAFGVRQVRHREHEVAEQVAAAGHGGDVEVDRVQVDDEAEQIQLQRTEVEREHRALAVAVDGPHRGAEGVAAASGDGDPADRRQDAVDHSG